MKKMVFLLIGIFLFFNISTVFALPTVFPTGVTIHKPDKSHDGYNLFVPINLLRNESIKLIDMDGNVVKTWDTDPGNPYLVKPLPNGNVMWNDANEHWIFEADKNGNPVWWYTHKSMEMHHDFQRLDNGNTLILARRELLLPRINPLPLTYDFLYELTPDKKVVWMWNSSKYFEDFGFSDKTRAYIYNYTWEDVPKVHTAYRDLYHTNSIQALPANKNDGDPRFKVGNILMSQRNTNIVFIIDKDTGDIVWKIGPDDNLTLGQHDAQMIDPGIPGEGNILIFDNGSDGGYPWKISVNYSRVVEVDPMTKEVVWEYNAYKSGQPPWAFFSPRISGAQRLSNGNTLINSGMFGRFFEVTADGEIVWEYIVDNPTKEVYRMYRVETDWLQ